MKQELTLPRTTCQTHPTKDHPHPTGQGQSQTTKPTHPRGKTNLSTLPFPIPLNMKIVSSTKDTPSSPSIIKTLKHGHCQEVTNFHLFDHPLPRHLGVNDEPIPNPVLDIGFMPLLMVEHFIIVFNPYGPKCNSSKKMPNLNFLPYFLGILSPNNACF